MFKKIALASAAAVAALTALPAAADAQPNGRAYGYWNNSAHARASYDRYDRYDRGYDRRSDRRYSRGYDRDYDRGYDRDYDRGYDRDYDDRYDHDDYGYERRRSCSGTTGTIVGGVAGALVGRQIDRSGRSRYGYGRRDSGTTGAIIGGALGALAGRAVDKGSCRR